MYRVQSKRGKPRHTCGTETRSTLWENPLDPFPLIGENPDKSDFVFHRGETRGIYKNLHPAGKPAIRTNKQQGQGKRTLSLSQFNHIRLTGMYYNKIRGEGDRENPVFIGDSELLIIIPIVGNCDEMNRRDEKHRIYTPGGIRNRPSHRRSREGWHPLHTPDPIYRLTIELFCAIL